MAEIQFDYEIDIAQEFTNICIGNEPNNRLVLYGIQNKRQANDDMWISNGYYTSIVWSYLNALMSAQAVSKIGIKSFPQIGAIGFYTIMYENRSVILAPLITETEHYTSPYLNITQFAETIQFNITDPTDVIYACYRIIVRLDYFAEEFVTYEKTLTIDKPISGTYQISIAGYIDDRMASELRDYPNIVIINPNPPIPIPIGDPVYSVNDELPDGSGNVIITAENIPFDDASLAADDVKAAILEVLAATGAITLSLTLDIDDWVSDTQVVYAPGVTDSNLVFVAPTPGDQGAYTISGVVCTEQASNALTFTYTTAPISDIHIYVAIFKAN